MFTVINTATRYVPVRLGKSKEELDAVAEVMLRTSRTAFLKQWKHQALLGTARKRKGPGKGRTLTSLKHKEHLVDLRRFREED